MNKQCHNGIHEWSNQFGDDWTPEVGTPCDCRLKQWGIQAPPTALVEPREPESTRHIVSVSMLRAAAGMLNACAEHLEPLAVGYGAHQMRSIANELSALAELVPSGSVATVVQPPAVVERAQSQEPLPIVDGDPSDLGTAREWFVAFCETREELKQLGKEVQQLRAAVVERTPLEEVIARWRRAAEIIIRTTNHHPDPAATWLLKCADELEALLLAWPSSREREKDQ